VPRTYRICLQLPPQLQKLVLVQFGHWMFPHFAHWFIDEMLTPVFPHFEHFILFLSTMGLLLVAQPAHHRQ
jgi:hypothetical protein